MPSNHDLEDSAGLALLNMRLCEEAIVDVAASGIFSAGLPAVQRLNDQIIKLLTARMRLRVADGNLGTLIENLTNWRDAIKK